MRDRDVELPAGLVPRLAAFEVLRAVEAGASWASAWMRAGSWVRERSDERRFAHELTSGSLRLRGRLDWILAAHASRPLQSLEPGARVLLRLGAYQLLETGAVPDHAAVHATVEVAKRRVPHAAGFVNAVLRAVLRGEVAFPDREREPASFLATWGSHPPWIVERWIARFGVESAAALCEFDNRRPEVCLRANRLRSTRAELLDELPGSSPGALSPDAVRCATPAYAAVRRVVESGRASVQDESGMLVAPLLEPQRGGSVLDLAAAPGGKACHLAELLGDTGTVFAFDRSANRLERVRENAVRLGLRNVVAAQADARRLAARPADGVLLDAPCSGLGVLARRPDLRWRKGPEDLPRLARLQRELLDAASRHVRPGGRLVYSVCSFEPEETEQVAAGFAVAHPEFEPDDVDSTETLRAGPGFLYFLPHRDGTDGGFAARWRRRG